MEQALREEEEAEQRRLQEQQEQEALREPSDALFRPVHDSLDDLAELEAQVDDEYAVLN
jgi:hypothetical protein